MDITQRMRGYITMNSTHAPADHYTPAKRTLEQVKAFLAKCAKHGSDRSAAKCLLHGNLNDDAMAYVVEYLS